MKKVIILALGAVFASLLLVGCTDDSISVGDIVRILESDGSEMYEGASPSSAVVGLIPAGDECEVVFEPRTVADVTLAKLDCVSGITIEEVHLVGWVDVTQFEVLE